MLINPRKKIYDKLCILYEETTFDIFIRSLKMNYIFFTTLFIILYVFAKFNSNDNSYVNSLITFMIVTYFGWWVHYFVHENDFEKIYAENTSDIMLFIKNNWLLNKIGLLIAFCSNFHDKIHHDSGINKRPFNWAFECIQNFIMEGGLILFLSKYLNFSVHIGHVFKLNNAVLLLWGLLYTSVHNINYIILGCNQHEKHHINPKTNYGIDTIDILFDTKYDKYNIENFNHATINLVVITLVILYYKIYL